MGLQRVGYAVPLSTLFLTNGDNSSSASYGFRDRSVEWMRKTCKSSQNSRISQARQSWRNAFSASWPDTIDLRPAGHQRVSSRKDIIVLPSPYRERVRPYFLEQYFRRYGTHHGVCASRAIFPGLGPGKSKTSHFSRTYCSDSDRILSVARRTWRCTAPSFGHYYFILSAFYIFVLDEPGHPVGTPFPGGFAVKKRDDGFYCPIRDKEKDVTYSICNFCPAKQEDMP